MLAVTRYIEMNLYGLVDHLEGYHWVNARVYLDEKGDCLIKVASATGNYRQVVHFLSPLSDKGYGGSIPMGGSSVLWEQIVLWIDWEKSLVVYSG
jgi:hypothetical protein